jgi:hypothetical protein
VLLCGLRGTVEFVGVVMHLPLLNARQLVVRFGIR